MRYRVIGGEKVSAIGLGSWDVRDPYAFIDTLVKGFEMGINLVDTAEMYRTEPLIAEAMKKYGKEVFVTTKLYPWHLKEEEECFKALERQRKRLGKVPDLTLVHWPEDIATEVKILEKAAEKGLTRMIGVSNVTKEQYEVAIHSTKKHEIVAVQNKYSLWFRRTEEILGDLEKRGIALQAHTPLEKGRIVTDPVVAEIAEKLGVPRASVALAWLLQRSKVVIPIPKTESAQHLEELVRSVDLELPEWAIEKLNNL